VFIMLQLQRAHPRIMPQEIMAAMVTEPPGCGTTACGGSCGAGLSTTYSTDCAGGRKQLRCCPLASYPDVLVLVDKGRGVAMSQHLFPAQSMGHADYTLLDSTWSTAKLLRALPGANRQLCQVHAATQRARALGMQGTGKAWRAACRSAAAARARGVRTQAASGRPSQTTARSTWPRHRRSRTS
jgi:hypothetical protein